MVTGLLTRRLALTGLIAGSLLVSTGCKQFKPNGNDEKPAPAAAQAPAPAPRSDQDIANDVQGRINAESALTGQNIQVSVNGGTVTLNGNVNNDAARALAAADSGAAAGVRTVINNLTVAPERAQKQEEPKAARRKEHRAAAEQQAVNEPAPPPPAEPAPAAAPAPPPPPPKPVARTVSVASGTSLPVRITEAMDSNTTQTGQTFHGTLAADIIADNMIAIPRGSAVTGRVIQAKDAAHFAGSSMLSVELTSVQVNGQPMQLSTAAYTQEGKGRGKNTAIKAGGGAALGAIIGGLAGGGKGAAIGAASGGGLGAGVNAVTKGEQVKIPAETLVNFKLQSPLSVTTSHSANGPAAQTFNDDSSQPQ